MPSDLSRSAIHTFTTKPWTLSEACERYAAAGIAGISVWRQHLESVGIAEAARIITASGLAVPALVRGGFFTSRDAGERQRAVDDNRGFLDEAATLGADQVVLVVGATPGLPLAEARQQVQDGIGALLDHAAQVQVKLAIEPLHPMYAGDKSCINSMTTARAIWEALPSPWLGVAVDVYHVWFDERLADEIAHAGGALVCVDNTFASPMLQNPLELGADLVLHSMTKFINGHSDVVAGMVVAKEEELYRRVLKVHKNLGGTMDPHQAWLVSHFQSQTWKPKILSAPPAWAISSARRSSNQTW